MVSSNVNTILDEEWSFHSSAYVPTGNNDLSTGAPTVVDLTLDEGGTGLADTAAINSDQVDLGTLLPTWIDVIAAIEWFAAVTAGNTVDFYWAESANSGVGVGNPGGVDGIDGLYTGTGDGGTNEEAVINMIFIGSFVTETHTLGHVQIAKIGRFVPTFRYGQLVVVNNSGTTLCGTDDIESSVLLYGTMPDIQVEA